MALTLPCMIHILCNSLVLLFVSGSATVTNMHGPMPTTLVLCILYDITMVHEIVRSCFRRDGLLEMFVVGIHRLHMIPGAINIGHFLCTAQCRIWTAYDGVAC
jgi:hypothetical protein